MKALILAVLIITAMFTQTKVFYQKPDGIMLLRGTFEIAAMPEPNGFLCYMLIVVRYAGPPTKQNLVKLVLIRGIHGTAITFRLNQLSVLFVQL